jgi:hypothetical protein
MTRIPSQGKFFTGGNEVLTKEWLEKNFEVVSKEHEEATQCVQDASTAYMEAQNNYYAAINRQKSLEGVINGLKNELDFLEKKQQKSFDRIKFFQETLEYCMEENRTEYYPKYSLAAMTYRDGLLEGYFVCQKMGDEHVQGTLQAYVHIYETHVIPEDRIINDIWLEKALIPIDGFTFPHDAILLKEKSELEEMGFYFKD